MSPTSRNADLWIQVLDMLTAVGDRCLGVRKVASHTDYSVLDDEVERWLAYNNGLVDRAAHQANLCRPQEFWDVWDQLRKQWTHHYMIGKAVMEVHVATARAVRDRKLARVERAVEVAPPVVPVLHVPVCSEDRLRQVFSRFFRPFVMTLLPWLRLLDNMAAQSEPRWISFAQLYYITFCRDTNFRPPYYRTTTKQWYCVGSDPVRLLRVVEFSRRVTWFQQQVRACVAATGGSILTKQLQPMSEYLQIQLCSTFLRFPAQAYVDTEAALSRALTRACCRHDARWKTMDL